MRITIPITVALVVLTTLVAPITAAQTTYECETTTVDGGMAEESMNGTTTATMTDGSMTTTESMGNETTTGETTTCVDDEGMDDGMTDTTSEMGDSMDATTSEMSDSMDDATESMADEKTTDAPESGSSAFAPGLGVAAAVVALLGALLLARGR